MYLTVLLTNFKLKNGRINSNNIDVKLPHININEIPVKNLFANTIIF